MHTTTWKDESGRVWYAHHHGDFSGSVMIETGDGAVVENQVAIPFGLMKELVGCYLIDQLTDAIEQTAGNRFIDSIGSRYGNFT